MKRSHYVLMAMVVVAAFAGWGVAYFEHKGRVERAATEALAEARKPGLYLAKLIRDSDAATLVYLPGKDDKDERLIQISDPQWRERLAAILESATYEVTGTHLLGISQPMVRIYKNGKPVLSLMLFGKIISPYCDAIQGNLIVDEEITASIWKLVAEQDPKP
jgi:hypothetical protein